MTRFFILINFLNCSAGDTKCLDLLFVGFMKNFETCVPTNYFFGVLMTMSKTSSDLIKWLIAQLLGTVKNATNQNIVKPLKSLINYFYKSIFTCDFVQFIISSCYIHNLRILSSIKNKSLMEFFLMLGLNDTSGFNIPPFRLDSKDQFKIFLMINVVTIHHQLKRI